MSINELVKMAEIRILNQELEATIAEHRRITTSTMEILDRIESKCGNLMARNLNMADQNTYLRTLIDEYQVARGDDIPNFHIN